MILNKSFSLFCLAFLYQGVLILSQPELIPCIIEGEASPNNVCTLEFAPVCAFRDECQGIECLGTTVGNSCEACFQGGYDYYTLGECPEVLQEEALVSLKAEEAVIFCQTLNEEVQVLCATDFNPVCAYFAGEEDSVGETVSNACIACNQFGYDYYTFGPCETVSEEELTTFEEEAGPVLGVLGVQIPCETLNFENLEAICTLEFNPVCAYSANSNMVGSFAANPCVACFLQGFDYYTIGRCPT